MAGASIQAIDGRVLTPASLSIAANGVNAVLAAATGVIYRVHRLFLNTVTAVTVQFQDGGNNLSGVISMPATGLLVLPFDGTPWFTTSPGNAFNINLGGAIQVSGMIYFTQTGPAGL